MGKVLFTLFILFTFSVSAQKKNESGAYYDYNVRCIGIELDGSITVESFGKGRNYKDAAEQAKKNAVYAVVFKGIKEGNGGCSRDPLLYSSNAVNKHELFFANFFADDGEYLNFVSLKDERINNKFRRKVKKSKNQQQRMVVVRVNILQLKAMLKEEGVN